MQPNLNAQTEWGWKIAAYLFLAGAGAGAYAWGVIGDFVGGFGEVAPRIGVMLGFPMLFLGSLFLIADLGVKSRALNAFLVPRTSWIGRGTYIITAFMLLSFVHAATWVWPFQGLADNDGLRHVLGGVTLVFALLTMIYTGVLLGASRPIAMWSTAMLPALFLVSALSTGLMAVALCSAIAGMVGLDVPNSVLLGMAGMDAVVIAVEILVVILYLQAAHKVPESRVARDMVLRGRLATHFWLGVVVVGLLGPLAIEALTYAMGLDAMGGTTLSAVIILAALLGLTGGLWLRYVVLACGVRAPLRAGNIEYSFANPFAVPR